MSDLTAAQELAIPQDCQAALKVLRDNEGKYGELPSLVITTFEAVYIVDDSADVGVNIKDAITSIKNLLDRIIIPEVEMAPSSPKTKSGDAAAEDSPMLVGDGIEADKVGLETIIALCYLIKHLLQHASCPSGTIYEPFKNNLYKRSAILNLLLQYCADKCAVADWCKKKGSSIIKAIKAVLEIDDLQKEFNKYFYPAIRAPRDFMGTIISKVSAIAGATLCTDIEEILKLPEARMVIESSPELLSMFRKADEAAQAGSALAIAGGGQTEGLLKLLAKKAV